MYERPVLDFGSGVIIWRVPISLPCNVPVVPGTPDTSAPIEQRTERCAVDGWWNVGRAFVCDHHLAEMFIGTEILEEVRAAYPGLPEPLPWETMHRYSQDQAVPAWEQSA